MEFPIQTENLYEVYITIFKDNSKRFASEDIEFFYYRSTKTLRKAIEDSYYLYNILHTFLPEHLGYLEWNYQASPDNQPLPPSRAPNLTESGPLRKVDPKVTEEIAHLNLAGRRYIDSSIRYY